MAGFADASAKTSLLPILWLFGITLAKLLDEIEDVVSGSGHIRKASCGNEL